MFYLKLLLKIWIKNPFKALANLALSLCFVLIAANYTALEALVAKYYKIESSGPYFHALIPGKENSSWIARKIGDLPGVKKVEVISKDELGKQLKVGLGNIIEELPTELSNFQQSGLKVVFSSSLSTASQNLIRDYLLRLIGNEDQVVLGQTVDDKKEIYEQDKAISKTKKYALPLAYALVIVFLLLSYFSFDKTIRHTCYLVERFQRRRRVSFKLFFFQQCTVAVLALIICLLLGPIQSLNLILAISILFLLSLFHLRKFEWVEG